VRKECVAKRRDLNATFVYKASCRREREPDVGHRHRTQALDAQCVRCKRPSARKHVHRRDETVLENQVKVTRMGTMRASDAARTIRLSVTIAYQSGSGVLAAAHGWSPEA
jgi:hypothetical protein